MKTLGLDPGLWLGVLRGEGRKEGHRKGVVPGCQGKCRLLVKHRRKLPEWDGQDQCRPRPIQHGLTWAFIFSSHIKRNIKLILITYFI